MLRRVVNTTKQLAFAKVSCAGLAPHHTTRMIVFVERPLGEEGHSQQHNRGHARHRGRHSRHTLRVGRLGWRPSPDHQRWLRVDSNRLAS